MDGGVYSRRKSILQTYRVLLQVAPYQGQMPAGVCAAQPIENKPFLVIQS